MKAEINRQNKERFFALHWGQKVLTAKGFSEKTILTIGIADIGEKTAFAASEDWFLELKPLSSISDEDAAAVCWLNNSNFPELDMAAVQGRQLVNAYLRKQTNLWGIEWLKVFDLLRSKGYALPWMGLSVEEMCEAGWIKLTS